MKIEWSSPKSHRHRTRHTVWLLELLSELKTWHNPLKNDTNNIALYSNLHYEAYNWDSVLTCVSLWVAVSHLKVPLKVLCNPSPQHFYFTLILSEHLIVFHECSPFKHFSVDLLALFSHYFFTIFFLAFQCPSLHRILLRPSSLSPDFPLRNWSQVLDSRGDTSDNLQL